MVQIVKQAEGSFLSEHLEELKEAASKAPLKYQLKLRSHLASVEEELQMACYFEGLQARETGLRWTAAKALVRACPSSAVEMITERIVTNIDAELEREASGGLEASPAALHGYLLAIGRFIHHGKLTNVSAKLIAVLLRCLRFDQIKGSYAVGSFVRDAACYVAWTASRCIIDVEEVDRLACALTCLALFDREVSCRRAGAAALQELVGRSGCHDLLPVLEVIHFASVSTLTCGFRQNFLKVMECKSDWTVHLAKHLLQVTMKNFDTKVRELAGEVFSQCGGVESLITEYQCSADDLFYRHGILLAMSYFAGDELISFAQEVIKIPVKSLGFDLLLEAYLKLITKLPFQEDWLVALSTAFKTRNDSVRGVAVVCLQEQASRVPDRFSSFFAKCLSGVEAERDVYTQRGCIAALSAIPPTDKHFTVLSVLLKAAKQTRPLNDIDRRCEALRSVKWMLGREMLGECDCRELLRVALEEGCLMDDYTVDMRGDVGSQVRLLAMSVLEASKLPLSHKIVNLLLEQRWGRIQKLREAAEALLPGHEGEWSNYEGFYRGLIYTAGGLDAQLSEEAIALLKQQESNNFLLNCLRSALKEHNGRLQMPALLTIEQLWHGMPQDFVRDCVEYLKNEFVSKQAKNIRKLMGVFRILKALSTTVEGLSEFLTVQALEHEYPAIRQLLLVDQ